MKSTKTVLIYGFMIWVIPFLVAMFTFSFRESNRGLFESIMSVALVSCIVGFAVKYLKTVEAEFLREGIFIGIIWLAASLALDFPMFSWGPMNMSASGYLSDIGLTYLIIPIITIGFGYILEEKNKTAYKLNKS